MIQKKQLPAEAYNIQFSDDDFLQNRQRAIDFFKLLAADKNLVDDFGFDIVTSVGDYYKQGKFDYELLNLMCKKILSPNRLKIFGQLLSHK